MSHLLYIAFSLNHIYTIIHLHESHKLWTNQFLIKILFIWKRNYLWTLCAPSVLEPIAGDNDVVLCTAIFKNSNNLGKDKD